MSTPTFADVLNLTHGLQQDLRDAQAKLTTIRSWLAAQPAEKRTAWICPRCGSDRPGPNALEDHLVNVHGLERDRAAEVVVDVEAKRRA